MLTDTRLLFPTEVWDQDQAPSIEDILRRCPNPLYENELEKERVLTDIVNTSSRGSLSDEDATRLIADLKQRKATTPPDLYYEWEETLDCYLVNNLAGGMINPIYDLWNLVR